MSIEKYLNISEEVRTAVSEKKPVVALESTIISHGMPYPRNYETALEVEKTVRENNAVPATIAILKGIIHVGLNKNELEFLAAEKDIYKVAKRILVERKKRELDPIFKVLSEVKTIDENIKDPEVKAFTDRIRDINGLVNKADNFANIIIKSDEHWFMNNLLKLMK